MKVVPLLRALPTLTFSLTCTIFAGNALASAPPPTAQPQLASVAAADKLFNDDKYEEAKTAYKGAVRTTPKNAAAHLGLLRSLYRLDDWKAGITEARAAEAVLPQNPEF